MIYIYNVAVEFIFSILFLNESEEKLERTQHSVLQTRAHMAHRASTASVFEYFEY